MKFKSILCAAAGLAISACAYIPTNGNDTSFTRTGTMDCPEELQIDPNLLGGSETAPLRCGPQDPTL